MTDASSIAAPYLAQPPAAPRKKADARRWLRVARAERDMGIPRWKPRCKSCGAIISGEGKTGMCRSCARPKTASCRAKAERLYRAGVSSGDIAKLCDISRERVCQFLRPTGLIGTTVEQRKMNMRARRRAGRFRQRLHRLRRRIMRRYFAVRLFKAGYSVQRIRTWVQSAQAILTKAGCKRPVSYRSPFRARKHRIAFWEPFADGKWHCITMLTGRKPISAYYYGKTHGLAANIQRTSKTEFLVRFTPK